ncbi:MULTISPECIES: tyrosine-type recombinase/integrase [unclassified Carboxylicivirga]|uniref:tyrosine-type recombinase/integrase n=1 Tax=Carboxylicivirga TaxID=1628153 RepID=UPI003D3330C9
MSAKVSTAIVLFKKRLKKNGKYPAKLRLTHNRKQMYYTIDTKNRVYDFTEDEFEKIIAPKPRGEYKEIQLEFSLIEEKANKIIKELSNFSFDQFKTHFGITGGNMRSIFHYLDIKINAYKKNGYGDKTAKPAKLALQKFFNREVNLEFKEITIAKLRDFEHYMKARGIKPTTYSRYVNSIKSAFIMALKDKTIPQDLYPFGRDKYYVPRCVTIKRALKINEIEKIYKYQPEPFSHEDEARDLWLFSYLCNGINMTDLFHLKYKDISSEFITFIRKKTEHSSGTQRPILIPISKDIQKIIDKRGNPDRSPNNYVFPLISDGLSPHQKIHKIAWRVRKTNIHMQRIGKKLGIEKHITTYTARHSFATILKRSGVSTEFISESLGHSDVKMTETYLDSFESDHKKEVAKYLTAF